MTAQQQEFVGPERRMAMSRMILFSGGIIATPGWPVCNLHTNAEKARATGLKAPIASGIQTEGHLISLLLDMFGEEWLWGGRMSIKHVGQVFEDDVVVTRARIVASAQAGDVHELRIDVACDHTDGRPVFIGEAALCERVDEAHAAAG